MNPVIPRILAKLDALQIGRTGMVFCAVVTRTAPDSFVIFGQGSTDAWGAAQAIDTELAADRPGEA